MSTNEFFGPLSDIYEALIDWPRRLTHEAPFYRRLFAEHAVGRLIDVACGTGHHAAMFHQWGLTVEGADVSPEMVDRARARHAPSDTLRWVARGFDQPVEPASSWDAAICVGNSLALAGDREIAAQAIRQMLAAVRPGGLVVVHVLNLWHLADGPCRWQKCRRLAGPRGELLVVKGVHRSGGRGFVDLIVTDLNEPSKVASESVPFLGLDADWLAGAARRAGAASAEFHGGYAGQPYEREESVDLILVARRS